MGKEGCRQQMWHIKRLLIFAWLAFALFGHEGIAATVQPSPDSVSRGRELFATKCGECHTIGEGRKVGPDLYGILKIRPLDYMVNFISNPSHMFQKNDPIAIMVLEQYRTIRMPDLNLSREQILDILAYIEVQSAKPRPILKKPTGNPETGRRLFDGRLRFRNDGPPCISCHNIAMLPFPMGGTMGPDLTGINPYFAAVSAPTVFPSMIPLYSKAPLTGREPENLEAFIDMAGVEQSVDVSALLAIIAEILFALAVLSMWFLWRRRIGLIRDSLTPKPRKRDRT